MWRWMEGGSEEVGRHTPNKQKPADQRSLWDWEREQAQLLTEGIKIEPSGLCVYFSKIIYQKVTVVIASKPPYFYRQVFIDPVSLGLSAHYKEN